MTRERISVCTVCMNRLDHVRQTLPANIRENIEFGNIEFVLLDYNSSDGLGEWIGSAMKEFITGGFLKYYRTDEPVYFSISHSKNMAVKLATGDIICLVDADNYAGPGYVHWIYSVFAQKGPNALVMFSEEDCLKYGDLGGKIAFHRRLFEKARGFDESLQGYGMDDLDVTNRLEKAGGNKVFIEDRRFMSFIGHSSLDRVRNYELMSNLEGIYVLDKQADPDIYRVLYLRSDESFQEIAYRIDKNRSFDKSLSFAGMYMVEDGWRSGVVLRVENGYILTEAGEEPVLYRNDATGLCVDARNGQEVSWERVGEGENSYLTLVMAYSDCQNRLKYHRNDKRPDSVNPGGWGRGRVYSVFPKQQSL